MALCLESNKKKSENVQDYTNKNNLYKDTHIDFFKKN